MPLPVNLTIALKEWAVAVDALVQGQALVLLRKGGLREQGGSFTVADRQAWLYPTYEHQVPHLLQAPYAPQVQPVPSGWHPDCVEIKAWATITHQFQVREAAVVEALMPFQVWNLQFVQERLKWKPRSPLAVLVLRVYALPQPQTIAYAAAYGGCKSWIELQDPPALKDSWPALSDEVFHHRVAQIEAVLAQGQ